MPIDHVPIDMVGEAKPASDPISDLVQALDRSESRPGYGFVALKWFRDVVLPAFRWARLESARQAILREAIEKRFVLTSKVPNPKSPEFPVTAIRLKPAASGSPDHSRQRRSLGHRVCAGRYPRREPLRDSPAQEALVIGALLS